MISIDYAVALFQAKKLDAIAAECDEVRQGIDRQLAAIDGMWEGEAAEAFKTKLNEYKQQNLRTQEEIRQTADSIRQVVQIIREADEAAARNAAASAASEHGSGGGRHG